MPWDVSRRKIMVKKHRKINIPSFWGTYVQTNNDIRRWQCEIHRFNYELFEIFLHRQRYILKILFIPSMAVDLSIDNKWHSTGSSNVPRLYTTGQHHWEKGSHQQGQLKESYLESKELIFLRLELQISRLR